MKSVTQLFQRSLLVLCAGFIILLSAVYIKTSMDSRESAETWRRIYGRSKIVDVLQIAPVANSECHVEAFAELTSQDGRAFNEDEVLRAFKYAMGEATFYIIQPEDFVSSKSLSGMFATNEAVNGCWKIVCDDASITICGRGGITVESDRDGRMNYLSNPPVFRVMRAKLLGE